MWRGSGRRRPAASGRVAWDASLRRGRGGEGRASERAHGGTVEKEDLVRKFEAII